MRIQKYLRPHLACTNRIRRSTRIRFVSGHLKGLVNRAWKISRGKRLVLILWRLRIQKSTDTSIHTYPDTQRIQKFPFWRAYTEISGYTEHIRWTRVDARCICIKKFADTKSPDTCGRGLNSPAAFSFVVQIWAFVNHTSLWLPTSTSDMKEKNKMNFSLKKPVSCK